MSQGKGSGAKDLSGASSISGLPFFERLTRKEVALGYVGEEEVGSKFGGITQEKAGAEERCRGRSWRRMSEVTLVSKERGPGI